MRGLILLNTGKRLGIDCTLSGGHLGYFLVFHITASGILTDKVILTVIVHHPTTFRARHNYLRRGLNTFQDIKPTTRPPMPVMPELIFAVNKYMGSCTRISMRPDVNRPTAPRAAIIQPITQNTLSLLLLVFGIF